MKRLHREFALRLGVLVLAAGLVVAGSVSGPLLRDVTPDEPPTHDEYAPSKLVPERLDATGEITPDRASGTETILIDTAHNNRFRRNEIQPLTTALTKAGYNVEYLDFAESLDTQLSRADAFVVIDPGTEFEPSEIDHVTRFVEKGGRLLLLGEPSRTVVQQAGPFGGAIPTTLRNNLDPISTRFGINFGEGYLYNQFRNDGNFQNVLAGAGSGDDLVTGVDRTAMYTATHVETDDGKPLLVGVEGTRNARNDDLGPYSLAVRDGNVVAIGDTTFLERGYYNVGDNEQFLANVISFLGGGERTFTLLDYPAFLPADPTIRYTERELLSAAQSLGRSLTDPGSSPQISPLTTEIGDGTTVLLATFDQVDDMDLGAGVTVADETISVSEYGTVSKNTTVVRKLDGPIELLIAANSPEKVSEAVSTLTRREIRRFMVSNTTALLPP